MHEHVDVVLKMTVAELLAYVAVGASKYSDTRQPARERHAVAARLTAALAELPGLVARFAAAEPLEKQQPVCDYIADDEPRGPEPLASARRSFLDWVEGRR
jgi:hypothetical protein